MYFSTIDRLCVELILFSTVLLNIAILKIGLIVVQWENENSVSVLNEEKIVSRRGVKRRDNSWHTDWYNQGSRGHL